MNQSPAKVASPSWTHRFAVVWVVAMFCLLLLGGTVTSKGVGLSVPDWPTTFGFNMFGVPLDMWIGRGGIFWEHSHRLAGSLVGLMTIVIAQLIWMPWLNQKLPYRLSLRRPWLVRTLASTNIHGRAWLRWLALAALLLVIVQGVMGGLRVTEMSTSLAVLHGVTGQLCLCVAVLIAAATNPTWSASKANDPHRVRFTPRLRRWSLLLLGALLIQLVLGAVTRHTGSRLAIPDFPSSYGRLIPPLTHESLEAAIDEIPYEQVHTYHSLPQVVVHFAHRAWGMVVVAVVAGLAIQIGREAAGDPRLLTPAAAVIALLLAQVALGALVIWTGLSGDWNDWTATAHQGNGAALLATAVVLAIRTHRLTPLPQPTPTAQPAARLRGSPA